MIRRPSRLQLWLSLVIADALVAYWVWSATQERSLVERVVWGLVVIAIAFSRYGGPQVIKLLAQTRDPNFAATDEDNWFICAFQLWIFPFGIALITQPIARSFNIERPEGIALASMFIAMVAWVSIVLRPRASLGGERDSIAWWERVPPNPTTALWIGCAGGALLISVSLYLDGLIHGVAWPASNWAFVIVGIFLGSLLNVTRWIAVTMR